MSAGPYAQAAWAYRRAGWAGVIPLPPGAKWPPPGGFTGWAGIDPSGADVQAWIDGPEGAGNIALRLPEDVYGLDVDAYGGKDGGAALRAAEGRLGPLPATWVVTSRDDRVSGIRLFRARPPAGHRWKDEPAGHGAGIEAIHAGHRYAVVWPSTHPDTGATYRWQQSDGTWSDAEVPLPDPLPELPAAWVEALSEPDEVATGEAASHEDTVAAVTGFPVREPCTRMRVAAAHARARLDDARAGAALHPAGRDATHELVRLGHEGHAGARAALAQHFAAFVEVRNGRGDDRSKAEAEWWRLVRGAVGKLAGPAREGCDCGLLAGDGVLFEPGEAKSEGGEGGAGGFDGDLATALGRRLLTAAQIRDLPPPRPLVEGLLVLDSESWLIARSGSYKTFVALDLAGHVATGKPWMQREVTQGEVLYLVAEGVGGMGLRVRAWEQRNGPMADVLFLPMPVQVSRQEHWEALVELGRRRQPVMIVLDTQARITVGLNENDNSEMGQFVEAIGKLRRATGACVLVVHHLGRAGQDARGASAIDGAQDSELRLTKHDGPGRRVTLETDKQRHLPEDVREELELFTAALDGGGTSLVVGPALTGVAAMPDYRANLSINQQHLVQTMIDIFPSIGATKAELKAETAKRPIRHLDGDLRPAPKNWDSSFRRAWDALLDSGRFEKGDHGMERYVLVGIDTVVSE